MPHASDSRRIEDPFGATDEVKVYKDEGEDEKPENLSEEKFGLVTETEEVKTNFKNRMQTIEIKLISLMVSFN